MNSFGSILSKNYPKLKEFITKWKHPALEQAPALTDVRHTSQPSSTTPLIDRQSINVLREAIENLHTALTAEHIAEKQKTAQEKIRKQLLEAVTLNIELHHDTTPYSWFGYYSEKNLADQISKQLMHLKEVLPHTWADNTRAEVRTLSFAYAHYFATCKKTLEQKLFSFYRNATFQMYN